MRALMTLGLVLLAWPVSAQDDVARELRELRQQIEADRYRQERRQILDQTFRDMDAESARRDAELQRRMEFNRLNDRIRQLEPNDWLGRHRK